MLQYEWSKMCSFNYKRYSFPWTYVSFRQWLFDYTKFTYSIQMYISRTLDACEFDWNYSTRWKFNVVGNVETGNLHDHIHTVSKENAKITKQTDSSQKLTMDSCQLCKWLWQSWQNIATILTLNSTWCIRITILFQTWLTD